MPKSPEILWPAAVVGLLLLSGVTTFGILLASRSDGGAQVVDNYYRKSVAWDSLASERRASENLGWVTGMEILPSTPKSGIATFTDKNGRAVSGLTGTVTVSRPQSAVTYGTHSLVAVDTAAGKYSFGFPYTAHGLWDLDVLVWREGERFTKRIRIEI